MQCSHVAPAFATVEAALRTGTVTAATLRQHQLPEAHMHLSQSVQRPPVRLTHASRPRSADLRCAAQLITPNRVALCVFCRHARRFRRPGQFARERRCLGVTLPVPFLSQSPHRAYSAATRTHRQPLSAGPTRQAALWRLLFGAMSSCDDAAATRPPAARATFWKRPYEHQMPFQSSKLPNASPAGIVAFQRRRSVAPGRPQTWASDGVALG